MSFLHHRFNISFLIGGVYYYHKDSIVDFLLSQDSENFLLQSIREGIDDVVFLACSRALGIIEKLISDPLFRSVVQAKQIFDLNNMWESLLNFLELNSHDASNLFNGNTVFDESLLTKDTMFEKLFQETENPFLGSLTEDCLELTCCPCFLMIKSQLRDHLSGGKYFASNNKTRSDLQNCPTTNIVSERDFAQYDQKLTQKPTFSDIAVCGVIMFNNNKSEDWLDKKSKLEIENLVKIARYNKHDRIKKYKKRKEDILAYKIDKLEKVKLEKEIKLQKQLDQKEYLTHSIQDIELLKSASEVEVLCGNKRKESDIKEILKNQILFRKHVLGQSSSSKKHFQMGESVCNKYKSFDVKQLKVNLIQIILFSSGTPEERATDLVQNSIKDREIRRRKLETEL